MNIVDILNKVSKSSARKRTDILEQIEIEYILKFCEINNNKSKKYKSIFKDKYISKIKISFQILYEYYINTNDKRMLNTLIKNSNYLNKYNVKYNNELISNLILKETYLK